ncbi:hypothetical protein Tco_0763625 [Tanacetum coccineum]
MFDMDGGVCHSRMHVEKIYMTNFVHEEEYFNPLEIEDDVFSYESHACLVFEQHTQSYDNESVDTIDLANNMQELKDKHNDMVRGPNLERIISRWHVCKPVRVFYDNECGKVFGMWPTCNLDLSFCSEYDAIYGKGKNGMLEQWMCFRDHERQSVGGNRMTFVDFLKEYPISNIKTYFPDFYRPQPRKPRPRDYSYEEWLRIKLGHTNVSKSVRNAVLNEWVLDSFDVEIDYGKTRDDPYSRRFDEYKKVFDNEIEQLGYKYDLRIGNKGYALDDVWEKCEKFHGDTVY